MLTFNRYIFCLSGAAVMKILFLWAIFYRECFFSINFLEIYWSDFTAKQQKSVKPTWTKGVLYNVCGEHDVYCWVIEIPPWVKMCPGKILLLDSHQFGVCCFNSFCLLSTALRQWQSNSWLQLEYIGRWSFRSPHTNYRLIFWNVWDNSEMLAGYFITTRCEHVG